MPESHSEAPEGERFFVCEFGGGEVAPARSTKDDADPCRTRFSTTTRTSDYDDFPGRRDGGRHIWAGSHPIDIDWSFEATPSVQEMEQVELKSPQSVDDEVEVS